MSSSLSRLPHDICRRIFVEVLFSAISIDSMRARIYALSSEWTRFVLSVPTFWTDVYVCASSSSDQLSLFLSRSAFLPLSFHLDLREPNVDLEELEALMSFLSPYFHRAERIRAIARSPTSLRAIQLALAPISCPHIRSLRLAIELRVSLADSGITHNEQDPPVWICDHFRTLEVLVIANVDFPYGRALFPSLRTLRLSFSTPLGFDALLNIVGSAPQLHILAINVPSIVFPECPSVLASPSLVTLRVKFTPDRSVARLTSYIHVPGLRSLELDLDAHDVRPDLLIAAHLFPGILRLRLSDKKPIKISCHFDFSAFPNVIRLDLRRCTGRIMQELIAMSSSQLADGKTTVLPRLEMLLVSLVRASSIVQFASLHGANSLSDGSDLTLQNIVYQTVAFIGPIREDVHVSRSWLANHITNFSLILYAI
ncbi:hypothetical protein B0H11DRAFT_2236184 [Mycena galericulata]|nr:hypothetical protein B0H11DRAFT_2236184 [Mycena galericulata]